MIPGHLTDLEFCCRTIHVYQIASRKASDLDPRSLPGQQQFLVREPPLFPDREHYGQGVEPLLGAGSRIHESRDAFSRPRLSQRHGLSPAALVARFLYRPASPIAHESPSDSLSRTLVLIGLGSFIYCTVIVRDIALKHAPVMSDSCDLFGTVFADGSRHWISSNDLHNLCLISHVSYRHFVNLAIDFYAYAWIALNIRTTSWN